MRSRQLETTLRDFFAQASSQLAAEVANGAEVPFDVVATASRRGRRPALYHYESLTAEYLRSRLGTLAALPTYARAVGELSHLDGLDGYLLGHGATHIPGDAAERARQALRLLLEDVFKESTDFVLHPGRLAKALEALDDAASSGIGGASVLAVVHGLALTVPEVSVAPGLGLVQADTLRGAPEEVLYGPQGAPNVLALATLETESSASLRASVAALRALLRALRLFAGGGVAFGALGWARVQRSPWQPLALGGGGASEEVILMGADQEDELRTLFDLVDGGLERGGRLAWALRRWELGCERDDAGEALTDYLLGLRALLVPDGRSEVLGPRAAALCAAPTDRVLLAKRIDDATRLERAVVVGEGELQPAGELLAHAVGECVRALVRDVMCGHLQSDLVGLADGLLAEPPAVACPAKASVEQQAEVGEVPDLNDCEDITVQLTDDVRVRDTRPRSPSHAPVGAAATLFS